MLKRILIFAIRIYQKLIAPILPNSCIYYPSCSEYAAQSIEKHGAIRGSLVSARRIISCNRFAKGGNDPATK